MRKHHPDNERIKRRYFAYLEEARRMSPDSVDQVAAAIADFERSTNHRPFKKFHIDQARRYKRLLGERINPSTCKPLAKATVHTRLIALKSFIFWLAGQPGYKSRISFSDADYFNPTANDGRIAKARRERPVPTLEQIQHTVEVAPHGTAIERRDRAILAFAILSGARDDAIASLSLKHIDMVRRTVFQDARTVRTKNRKTMHTWFFPVGDDFERVVSEWVEFLVGDQLFGPEDPLFPATRVGLNEKGLFAPSGLEREHWKNAAAIRRIFKEAFERAGLPYFNPHSFRKTLAILGQRICQTPEEIKAWSQNLGHEHVLTTFTSYGTVASDRQAAIMNALTDRSDATATDQVQDTIDPRKMEKLFEKLGIE